MEESLAIPDAPGWRGPVGSDVGLQWRGCDHYNGIFVVDCFLNHLGHVPKDWSRKQVEDKVKELQLQGDKSMARFKDANVQVEWYQARAESVMGNTFWLIREK
jgi:hypothetical protein